MTIFKGMVITLSLFLFSNTFAKVSIKKVNTAIEKKELVKASDLLTLYTQENPEHSNTIDYWLSKTKLALAINESTVYAYEKLDSLPLVSAHTAFDKAAELGINNPDYILEIAALQESLAYALDSKAGMSFNKHDFAKALFYYEHLISINPNGDTYRKAAFCAEEKKDTTLAASYYQEALLRGSTEIVVFQRYLALIRNESSRKDEYHNVLDQAINTYPQELSFLKLKAHTLINDPQKRIELMALYEEIAVQEVENYEANYNLGVYYFNKAVKAQETKNNEHFTYASEKSLIHLKMASLSEKANKKQLQHMKDQLELLRALQH